ncbi:MAG: glycosyltransferase [Eubacterium sp.]|nr:glycosyltransferase [Eubacterium sp.]
MNETVSIIVPVYRAESYIAEAVAMVRKQTYPDWELLLIEDCSPDESAAVIRRTLAENGFTDISVKDADTDTGAEAAGQENLSCIKQQNIRSVEQYEDSFGRRVILVCKAKNEGAAAARNTGLDMAQGRYISFLDADDVWFADKLEKELHFMRDRQAGFVFTAYEFGDEQANPTGKVVHVPPQLVYRQALSRTVIFTTTVLFDRNILPTELMRMPNVASEDTATWWQILRAGYRAYGLDEVLAVYRRPVKSLSSNKLVAMKRIWNLYRRQEKLSVVSSVRYFILWAYRATVRRL